MACVCRELIPKRYLTIMLCCVGMLIVHAMRVNVAVTVVTILDAEPHTKVGTIEAVIALPAVQWDAREIGLLHSVFYIGFILTLVPGGYLAIILPSHRLFGCAILVTSSLNLLLPVAIDDAGFPSTCILRVLQGLCEGLLFPASYAILRHWSTPEDRSKMGAIVLTGVYSGAVVGYPLSGYITHFYGWSYVFYVHGGIGLVWFVFWLLLVYEKPSQHPSITETEKKFIESRQGDTAVHYDNDKVPWRSILLSLPVQAINFCNFARSFVFFLLLTNEPAYLNVFGFNIALNGILSALPHLLMAITVAVSGLIADCLIAHPSLKPTCVRKLFTCIGFGVEAACFFVLVFVKLGSVCMVLLTIGVGFSGFTISGWQINHLDLAPRYASVLVGISTAVGTIAGIIVPIIIGHMTVQQTIENWQMVFLMTTLILLIAVVFYAVFGSGEKQPWADPLPDVKIVGDIKPVPTLRLTAVPTQIGVPMYGATGSDPLNPNKDTLDVDSSDAYYTAEAGTGTTDNDTDTEIRHRQMSQENLNENTSK